MRQRFMSKHNNYDDEDDDDDDDGQQSVSIIADGSMEIKLISIPCFFIQIQIKYAPNPRYCD